MNNDLADERVCRIKRVPRSLTLSLISDLSLLQPARECVEWRESPPPLLPPVTSESCPECNANRCAMGESDQSVTLSLQSL